MEEKITKFSNSSYPYLWRGLIYESKGQHRKASADYFVALSLGEFHDWQPMYLLVSSLRAMGRTTESEHIDKTLHDTYTMIESEFGEVFIAKGKENK